MITAIHNLALGVWAGVSGLWLSNVRQWFLDGGKYHSSNLGDVPVLASKETFGTHRAPRQGRCYQFDGVDDWVSLTDLQPSITTANDFTIYCELKVVDRTGIQFVFAWGGGSTSISLGMQSGSIAFDVRNPTQHATRVTWPSDEAWHTVRAIWNATTQEVKLFLDGVEQPPTPGGVDAANNVSCHLGRRQSPAYYWKNWLRNVRLYDRVEANPVTRASYGQYLCNEESGDIAYDSSGNGNHGVITNATLSTFHATDSGVTNNPANEVGHSFAGHFALANSTFCSLDSSISFAGDFDITADVCLDETSNAALLMYSGTPNGIFVNSSTSSRVYIDGAALIFNHPALVSGRWHSIRATRTGSDVRLFTDGVESTTGALTNSDTMIVDQVGRFSTTTTYMDGLIRRITIAGGSAWTFSEGQGVAVSDDTAANNDLTLQNATPAQFWDAIIPRDESDTSNDIVGVPLDYSGKAPYPAQVQVPCLTLDGVDDYSSTSVPHSDESTFAMFVKCTTSADAWVLGLSDLAFGGYKGIYVVHSTGVARVQYSNGTDSSFVAGTTVVNDDAWHHVALSISAGIIKLYVDGALEATDTVTGSHSPWDLFTVGALRRLGDTDGLAFLDGSAEDARLYRSALSDAEILYLASQGEKGDDPAVSGLEVEWPFQEGDGSTAYDVSGNGNHGAIANATLVDAWANRTNANKDHSIEYGGRVESGAFVPGLIDGSNAANGSPLTLVAGKLGNPNSRLNTNPYSAAELNGLGAETDYEVGDVRQSVAPIDTKFRRSAADGDDRFFTTDEALTGDDKTNAEAYVA